MINLFINSGLSGVYIFTSDGNLPHVWSDDLNISQVEGEIFARFPTGINQGIVFESAYEGAGEVYNFNITRYAPASEGMTLVPDLGLTISQYPEDEYRWFGLSVGDWDTGDYTWDIVLGDINVQGGNGSAFCVADFQINPLLIPALFLSRIPE